MEVIVHQTISRHPTTGKPLMNPHQRPEFLLLLSTENKAPVHHPADAVVKYRLVLRIAPLRQPACLSHDGKKISERKSSGKKILIKGLSLYKIRRIFPWSQSGGFAW
jgi:hypothetical protein